MDKHRVHRSDKVDKEMGAQDPKNVAMSRGRILLELAKKQASQKGTNVVADQHRSKRVRFGEDKDEISKEKGNTKSDRNQNQDIKRSKPNEKSHSLETGDDRHKRKMEKCASSLRWTQEETGPILAKKLKCPDSENISRIKLLGSNKDTITSESNEKMTLVQPPSAATGISKTVANRGDEPDVLEKSDKTPALEQLQQDPSVNLSDVDNNEPGKIDPKEILAPPPKRKSFFEVSDEKRESNTADTFHGIGPTTPVQVQLEEEESIEVEEEFDWKGAVDRFDTELYGLLQDFFESTFTFFAYKLGLQPKDEFEMEEHAEFGKVPVFCNEESQQYVEEVSKSTVHFIRKGVLDGAVFHVNMLNKENCPITQQRFILVSRGMFCADKMDVRDATRVLKTTEMCKTQLQQMLRSISDLPLEELKFPWYSQWSISLGLKKEFLHLVRDSGYDSPFIGDPSSDFFPWKKRPRLSQAVKLGLVTLLPKTPDGNIRPGVVKKIVEKNATAKQTDTFPNLKALREKVMQSQITSLSLPAKPCLPKLPNGDMPPWVDKKILEKHPTSKQIDTFPNLKALREKAIKSQIAKVIKSLKNRKNTATKQTDASLNLKAVGEKAQSQINSIIPPPGKPSLTKLPNGSIAPRVLKKVLKKRKNTTIKQTETPRNLKELRENSQINSIISQPAKPSLTKLPNGNIAPRVLKKDLKILKNTATKQTDPSQNLKAFGEKTQLQNNFFVPPQVKPSLTKLPVWEYFTSSSEDEDEDGPHRRLKSITRPKQKLFMQPISSLEVLPQLMILVYRIEYTNSKVTVDDAMIEAAKADQRTYEYLLKFSG